MNLNFSDPLLRVPVVKRPAYTIELEQPNPETTFAHCTIHVPWTGRVRRQLDADWQTVLSLHGGPLRCQVDHDDLKLQKFLRSFGFSHSATFTWITTGESKLIYKTKERANG